MHGADERAGKQAAGSALKLPPSPPISYHTDGHTSHRLTPHDIGPAAAAHDGKGLVKVEPYFLVKVRCSSQPNAFPLNTELLRATP